jgi:hypothetical protein
MVHANSESDIEQKCRVLAEQANCKLLKIQGNRGWPDRLLLLPWGVAVFIEFKRPSGTPSALQVEILEWLEKKHFKVALINSVQVFQIYLTHLQQSRGYPSSIKSEV